MLLDMSAVFIFDWPPTERIPAPSYRMFFSTWKSLADGGGMVGGPQLAGERNLNETLLVEVAISRLSPLGILSGLVG